MKKFILNILLALFPLVGGVLLIAFPAKAVMLAFLILSVFMIISGVKNLYYSVAMTDLPGGLRTVGIVKNTVSIVLGALIIWRSVTKPESLMSFVVYIIASYLLFTAVVDALDTRYMRKLGLSNGIGADVLVNIVFSLIMFLFPKLIGSTFLTIVGIMLLLLGALLLAGALASRKASRARPQSKSEPIDVDWEEK